MSSYMSCPPYCAMPLKDLGLPEEGGYGYIQAPPPPQPKSQADCKEGEVFEEVYPKYGPKYGQLPLIRLQRPVKLKTRCVTCEQKYLEYLQYIKEYGPAIKIIQQTKEEFIAKCKGTTTGTTAYAPKPITATATEEDKYKSFLLYAMIGVGLYLIISK